MWTEQQKLNLVTRLTRKTTVGNEGCFLFYPIKSNGYGQICMDYKNYYIHRVSYVIFVGSLTSGMAIDHLCRQRNCWNPAHLEEVSYQENVLRGDWVNNTGECKYEHGKENYIPNTYGYRQCKVCHRNSTRETERRRRRTLKEMLEGNGATAI